MIFGVYGQIGKTVGSSIGFVVSESILANVVYEGTTMFDSMGARAGVSSSGKRIGRK